MEGHLGFFLIFLLAIRKILASNQSHRFKKSIQRFRLTGSIPGHWSYFRPPWKKIEETEWAIPAKIAILTWPRFGIKRSEYLLDKFPPLIVLVLVPAISATEISWFRERENKVLFFEDGASYASNLSRLQLYI